MSQNHYFDQDDGSRIAYKVLEAKELKDNVPLVMIVGTWSTKEDFMDLDEGLAKHRKVILLDNRGMGESSIASSSDITIKLMAQDTIALVKHLGIDRFNLLGWDIGGHVALCAASNVPSELKLEKLIICASPKQFATSKFFDHLSKIKESEIPKNAQEHKEWIMRSLEKVCTDYLLKHPEKLDKLAELKANTHRPFEILKRQLDAIKHFDFNSGLKRVQAPTLVLHGEGDEVIPLQEGELLASEIPTAKLVKLPNVGHRFWFSESGPYATIDDFLI